MTDAPHHSSDHCGGSFDTAVVYAELARDQNFDGNITQAVESLRFTDDRGASEFNTSVLFLTGDGSSRLKQSS